jgi:hypothetical protein
MKVYVILPRGQNSRIPPHTLMMDDSPQSDDDLKNAVRKKIRQTPLPSLRRFVCVSFLA